MEMTSLPWISLVLIGMAAIWPRPEALACDREAIPATERPRYNELLRRMLSAVLERIDLANGYAFRVDGRKLRLAEAAEWVEMERKCCPFLTIELQTTGPDPDWWIRLTGPGGVKALLASEGLSQAP
jgi:hypothetical protein